MLKQHLCGWACSCFLTRLNFLIAGVIFTLLVYMLAETTDVFERIARCFSGAPAPSSPEQTDSSLKSFFDSHCCVLCMVGPLIGLLVCLIYYIRHCKEDVESNWQSPASRERTPAAEEAEAISGSAELAVIGEESEERREKIRDRKKTPARKPRSKSPKKRAPRKSPEKEQSPSKSRPRRRSKKSLAE